MTRKESNLNTWNHSPLPPPSRNLFPRNEPAHRSAMTLGIAVLTLSVFFSSQTLNSVSAQSILPSRSSVTKTPQVRHRSNTGHTHIDHTNDDRLPPIPTSRALTDPRTKTNAQATLASLQVDQQQEKQQKDDKEKAEQKALESQWVDYIISPVSKEQRQKIESKFTALQKKDLARLSDRTKIKYDGVAALVYLTRLCELGPRITGSTRMKVQIRALKKYFKKMGVETIDHKFQVRHPETGEATEVLNLIAQLHPKRKNRIMICCHYDTRPYADEDPVNPRAPLSGANDGASGVGFLMAIAPHLKKLKGKIGIDLVFFDAEEFIFEKERDKFFVGSTRFARDYAIDKRNRRLKFQYKAGVLVDMIADANLELGKEGNSLKFCRALTNSIWHKAAVLKVKEFHQKEGHTIRDDHIPLNEIAGIPTCDIIDFDYPSAQMQESYWHTTKDTPDKCSAVSMSKVAYVVYFWAKGAIKR